MIRYLHSIAHAILPVWIDAPGVTAPPPEPTYCELLDRKILVLEEKIFKQKCILINATAELTRLQEMEDRVLTLRKDYCAGMEA